ncbi:hypothetical protein E1A91_D12G060900v1 [Gossypium mustelinum]|uniref:Uncharacterized protein n=1 Tax=Gossypium mustelinum TaxID=34275 RepID=A0A5D2SB67_GOSMU|nr:hypothetical protein E1A91_D12G060900v1 [Gossypium mustelinum]
MSWFMVAGKFNREIWRCRTLMLLCESVVDVVLF